VILARNYMCSLMMISDMLSKHVGAVKVFLKKCFKINAIQLVHCCLSTPKKVTQIRHHETLYIRCLPCLVTCSEFALEAFPLEVFVK